MKKLLAILLALIVMLAAVPAMAAAAPEKWDISKSKTATNLDANYESKVTLSLPSAEEQLETDVVFVLDESSCSYQVKDAVAKMLENLYQQIKDTNAAIKIGAVQFRGEVTKLPLTVLTETTKDTVDKFMTERPETGGSNMSAGLLAGEQMLDADNSVENDRKYLILVSDGITYIWDNEKTESQENFGVNFSNSDTPDKPMLAAPDGWDVKHDHGYCPTDWSEMLKQIEGLLEKTVKEKASEYVRGVDISSEKFVKYSEKDDYASTVEIALYKSYVAYKSIAAKYNAYAVTAGEKSDMEYYPFGPSFMNYLAGGKRVDFSDIRDDILYLVGPGSTVTDRMGKTADYDFDFINSAANLSLKVDETAYAVSAKTESLNEHETARYLFTSDGVVAANQTEAPFVLHYYAKGTDGMSDECFVWDINVPVSNFAPVQLTYAVKLTNPKTAPGTYGTYDADGSKNCEGLHTNNSAVLRPVNSNNIEGADETFNKPTVSYTVSGGGGGHTHYDPTPSVPVVVVVPPKTGDMPLWYGIARFLGLVK